MVPIVREENVTGIGNSVQTLTLNLEIRSPEMTEAPIKEENDHEHQNRNDGMQYPLKRW